MPENNDILQEERLAVRLFTDQGGKYPPPPCPERFLAICEYHGVSSLILQALQKRNVTGTAWEEIRTRLETRKRQWLARNIYLLDRLRGFSSVLRKAGIPFIVLKGGSLLGVLYPDFGMRPLNDVDVLVKREDLDRILGLLQGNGWVIPPELSVNYWKERYFHLYIRTDDAISAMFELHWNLEKKFRHSIELEELWERSVKYQSEGESLNRLSNEDLILHLLVHLAHHYFSPRLIWVNDIQEMTTRSSLDWDRILARAERWKLRIPVHYSINYVEKIFPGVLPARVLEGGEIGWIRRMVLKAVGTDNPLVLTVPMRDPLLRLPFSLYFIDKPVDMAKFLWKNLGPKVGEVTRRS